MNRTNYNGTLRLDDAGKAVELVGWVHKKRNFGARNFIDLRDRSGLVQLVFNEDFSEPLKKVHPEYLLHVTGTVAPRKSVNDQLPTGQIEVIVDGFDIINESAVPPITIDDNTEALEDTRLHYRYLDLRRPVLTENLKLRHKVAHILRNFLDEHDFLEIETPVLGKSTPEGARDYLVPARNYPGSFFALPQSPQLYKQLLMISGFDRYYQIVKCFRDEDLRADRQPEFTQLDMEMSFMSQDEIMDLQEKMMAHLFKKLEGIELPRPFLRLSYLDAMNTYGSDKPDLRFAMPLCDLQDLFDKSGFDALEAGKEKGMAIKGLLVEGLKANNKLIKAYEALAKKNGAFRTFTFKYQQGWSGSAAKKLEPEILAELNEQVKGSEGDLLFVVQADWAKCCQALGALRNEAAGALGLKNPDAFSFCWVVDFPMFEYSESQDRLVSQHHPFTLPKIEDIPLLDTKPEDVLTAAYDMVCNGYELGGGSMRIYDNDLQTKIFEVLGMSDEQIRDQFGFFIDAFQYGTPPHGGLAYGLDRLVMILARADSIKEVIAFPKSASARDLLSAAPSSVSNEQLEELHLKVDTEE